MCLAGALAGGRVWCRFGDGADVRGYGLAVVKWLAGHSPRGQGVVLVAGSCISVRAGGVSSGAGDGLGRRIRSWRLRRGAGGVVCLTGC